MKKKPHHPKRNGLGKAWRNGRTATHIKGKTWPINGKKPRLSYLLKAEKKLESIKKKKDAQQLKKSNKGSIN